MLTDAAIRCVGGASARFPPPPLPSPSAYGDASEGYAQKRADTSAQTRACSRSRAAAPGAAALEHARAEAHRRDSGCCAAEEQEPQEVISSARGSFDVGCPCWLPIVGWRTRAYARHTRGIRAADAKTRGRRADTSRCAIAEHMREYRTRLVPSICAGTDPSFQQVRRYERRRWCRARLPAVRLVHTRICCSTNVLR